jgi:hypothetical protein
MPKIRRRMIQPTSSACFTKTNQTPHLLLFRFKNESSSANRLYSMDHPLSSAQILKRNEQRKQEKIATILADIRSQPPIQSDEDALAMYTRCISNFQKKDGKSFEKDIEAQLTACNVPFKSQVHMDANGMILESQGVHILDIVFGDPRPGTHISNYAVMSLKTSSRERAKLDTWTDIHPPKRFYYGSIEADYPTPEKFKESDTRKLVCVTPRKKDTRQFKLDFVGLIDEILAE